MFPMRDRISSRKAIHGVTVQIVGILGNASHNTAGGRIYGRADAVHPQRTTPTFPAFVVPITKRIGTD